MVEAGAVLAGAFLEAGLVDEIVLYQAPKILGGNGNGLFSLAENPKSLTEPPLWQTVSVTPLGNDIKWILQK